MPIDTLLEAAMLVVDMATRKHRPAEPINAVNSQPNAGDH
jgi:hypothetical protein